MSKEKTLKKLERISRALLEAKTFYEMWWVLRGSSELNEYVDAMNKYVHCSKALITTTLYTTIIALYKVTDKDSHNLGDLFKLLPKDTFSEEDIESYREVLTKHKTVRKAVIKLRNNVFGHNSIHLDYNTAFKNADLVPEQYKQYLADLVSMLCTIYKKLGNPIGENYFKSNAANELESIFRSIMFQIKKKS